MLKRFLKEFWRMALSYIRVLSLRIRGAKIGKRVLIGNVKISIPAKCIVIGDGAVIEDDVKVENIDRLEVGDYAKIKRGVWIHGHVFERGAVRIGRNSWIGEETIINAQRDVIISDDVGIGARSQVWTHGYFPAKADGFLYKYGEVIIRRGAWLPPSCIVLPGVEIGEYSVIGTGSVITKSLPPYQFCTGIPCSPKGGLEKVKREVTPEEKIKYVMDSFLSIWRKLNLKIREEKGAFCAHFFLYKFWVIPVGEGEEVSNYLNLRGPRVWVALRPPPNLLTKKDTWVNLSTNKYIKRNTLAEFLFIRTLLNECILRVIPE